MMAGRVAIGDLTVSPHTIPEALAEIQRLLGDKTATPRTIHCLNAHIHVLAGKDAGLRSALESAALVTADGMAIVWAASLRERCNMTELFRAYLDIERQSRRCLLLGGSPDEAEAAATTLARHASLRVCESCDGYQSTETYVRLIEEHRDLDLVLLGMGSPKSEYVATALAATGTTALVWHIGGGTIQFLAGTLREAPVWMRRTGLQWLYRLCLEPRRMWRRYLLGLPMFFWRVFVARRR